VLVERGASSEDSSTKTARAGGRIESPAKTAILARGERLLQEPAPNDDCKKDLERPATGLCQRWVEKTAEERY